MSSADHIPDTESIRYNYEYVPTWLSNLGEFDRWLKQIKAETWREGFDAGERDVWEHEHSEDGWEMDCIPNPYLEGEK